MFYTYYLTFSIKKRPFLFFSSCFMFLYSYFKKNYNLSLSFYYSLKLTKIVRAPLGPCWVLSVFCMILLVFQHFFAFCHSRYSTHLISNGLQKQDFHARCCFIAAKLLTPDLYSDGHWNTAWDFYTRVQVNIPNKNLTVTYIFIFFIL